MKGLQLDIVTPDKVVLNAEVDYVGVDGVSGQMGFLPDHAPLLTALKIGELYYKQGDKISHVFISGGFAQIADNKVTVLAESAELSSNIDLDRARRAKERAEKRLSNPDQYTDLKRAEIALARAASRIRIASL